MKNIKDTYNLQQTIFKCIKDDFVKKSWKDINNYNFVLMLHVRKWKFNHKRCCKIPFHLHLCSPVSALLSLDTKTIPAVKSYTNLTKKNKLFF